MRSDNDGEFHNQSFTKLCDENDISHKFSAAKTPQQSNVVGRKNHTLQEMKRSMLFVNWDKTPFELIFGKNSCYFLYISKFSAISVLFLIPMTISKNFTRSLMKVFLKQEDIQSLLENKLYSLNSYMWVLINLTSTRRTEKMTRKSLRKMKHLITNQQKISTKMKK